MFPLRVAFLFISAGLVLHSQSQVLPRHSLVFKDASPTAEDAYRFVASAPGYRAFFRHEALPSRLETVPSE